MAIHKPSFEVELILAERVTERVKRNKGTLQYYTKYRDYPFEESHWIHESSFNDLDEVDTPLHYWNSLSDNERQQRSAYWNDYFANPNAQQHMTINEIGKNYMEKFNILSISTQSNSQSLQNNIILSEVLKKSSKTEMSISPLNVSKNKKRKLTSLNENVNKKRRISLSTQDVNKIRKSSLVQHSNSNTELLHQRNAFILILATNKNTLPTHIYNDKIDLDYFDALNYQDKKYCCDHFVHYIVVLNKSSLESYRCSKYVHDPIVTWLDFKMNERGTNFKHNVAYYIHQHGPLHPYRVPVYVKNRQSKFKIKQQDFDQMFKNIKQIQTLLKNCNFNVQYYGLTVNYKMISLIADGKKDVEIRTSHFLSVPRKDLFGIKNKSNSQSSTLNDIIPDRTIIGYRPPERVTLSDNFSKEFIKRNEVLRPLYEDPIDLQAVDKILPLFKKWIFNKRLKSKNENPTIKKHNAKLQLFAQSCIKRLQLLRQQPFCLAKKSKSNSIRFTNKHFVIMQNILIYIFSMPWLMESLFTELRKQCYQPLSPLFAIVFGFIRIAKCCDQDMIYKYKQGKQTSNYQFHCQLCAKQQSVWKESIFAQFKNQHKSLFLFMELIFKIGSEELQKQIVDGTFITETVYKKMQRIIKQSVHI